MSADWSVVGDAASPDAATIERINELVPSDLANDVLAAVTQLDGEAKRSDILDRALVVGGWSPEELAVRSRYVGAARTFHLRTCADYAVTTCRDRGHLEGSYQLPRPLPLDRLLE